MLTYSVLTVLLQADNEQLESVQGVQRRRHKRKNNVPAGGCMYVRTDEGGNKGVMQPRGPDMESERAAARSLSGLMIAAARVAAERQGCLGAGAATVDLSLGFGCILKIGPWIGAP
jgi:hypothetical protein